MTVDQLPLFPGDESKTVKGPVAQGIVLTVSSSLSAAVEQFRIHMVQQQFAENTISSFLGDLHIFRRFLAADPPIGQIDSQEIRRFLHWLQYERGKPCSPKSYARRLTTLKVFFAWLADLGARPDDPAASVAHKPAQPPMPRILSDGQVAEVLSMARERMAGEKPDPRPYLLVSLILHTGIKKQECMGIKLSHIDASETDGPALQIRYENPRMRLKERRLRLPPGWLQALAQYRQVYKPADSLFPCTARNLEYVLTDLAKQAGLPYGLSFEMLRWTCAVRDYRARMDSDRLRRKLGLSPISWTETEPKIIALAEPPL